MYEFIRGKLVEKEPLKAIVETQGIGYRLAVPLSTYAKLPSINQEIVLYLSHVVREDAEILFAFLTKEERNLFETLITLSGIGPKTAQAIIGHIDIVSFEQAVAKADIRLLSKIPGIGKKTAERLVIEMRDKFKIKGLSSLPSHPSNAFVADAIQALMNLGYPLLSAQKAVQTALQEDSEPADLGKLIASSLQKI